MPPVVAAIATALSISTAMATVVLVSAIVMVATIAYAAYAMATMKKPGSYSSSQPLRDRTQVVRSAVEPRRYIYGEVMVSGPLIYALSTGSGNSDLYLVIALAGHEVEEIGDVYLGDKLSTDPVFDGKVFITKYRGTADQTADPDLIAASNGQWTVNHRGRGVAYIVVKLIYSSSAFPNGIPNIKAVVKGNNQIYDPRTGLTGYTNNWALCVRDYLTRSYGINCLPEEINEAQAIAAANISDEDIALAAGGTEKRYTCNGTFSAADKPLDVMKRLLTAAAGNVVWSQGAYDIHPAYYRLPEEYVITESDLRGPLGVQPAKSRREKFNTVRGTFADPADYWQQVDFPPVDNSVALAADGQELATDMELQFTTSSAAAQRIAKVHLEKELQGIVVHFPGKMTLFGFKPGDVVKLSISHMGWVEKEFRVPNWSLSEEGGVDLTLREESAASYDWNSGMETVVDPAPNTQLPDPFTVAAPTNLEITETLYAGSNNTGYFTNVALSWTGNEAQVPRYLIIVDGVRIGESTVESYTVNDVQPGDHTFEIVAVNILGVPSPALTRTRTILGKTAKPADVTNVRASATAYGGLILSWDAVADVDLKHYKIRFTADTAGTWESAVDVTDVAATSLTLPAALDGLYLVKAVDTGLRESETVASVITTIPSLANYNAIETADDGPTWPGSRTGTYSYGGQLYLAMAGLMDDAPIFDDIINMETYGGARPEGFYQMDQQVDLGTVQTARCAAVVDYLAVNLAANIDDVEDWDAIVDFDGEAVAGVGVQPQISLSQNGVDFGDWQPFIAGDYTARVFRFRLRLTSSVSTNIPVVNSLAVTVDMPDRVERGQNVSIAAGGTAITFAKEFMVPPIVRTTIQGATSGDTEKITAISTTGFTIQVLNAGSGAARTVDWQVVGY